MKRIGLISFAIFCILCACSDPFSPAPIVPREDGGDTRNVLNITTTHGGKRSIELTWDAVSGAVRYHIARANTPLETFVQCGETADNWFRFDVGPGTTAYYRVKAIFAGGKESGWSPYVMGSSLAQPFITDITEITESSATVTWYMDNVSDATYKADLRYIAYCFNQATGAEVAQIALDGSLLAENKAQFTGLFADTKYAYQIEAFLVSDQSNSEKSDIVDRETAIRSRPGAPVNVKASQGTSAETIELSFELPEPVKIKNGDYYEQHGLFFEIAKRVYSESGHDAYTVVCAYFGAEDETERHPASEGSSAVFFAGKYETGKTVTWTDTSVRRESQYEYQVKAYVDGTTKKLSSDESMAKATGWALARGTLSIGKPIYTLDETGLLNASAKLPLSFAFDPRGVEYFYKVQETINPLEDGDPLNPMKEIKREIGFLTYQQVNSYTATMDDLTIPTGEDTPGRGLYSYKVMIYLSGGTWVGDVEAIGDVLISENVKPIIVEGFAVQDGFTNKFLVTWMDKPNQKYVLYESDDGKKWDEWNGNGVVSDVTSDDEEDPAVPASLYIEGYGPNIKKYFALQPAKIGEDLIEKKGQRVYHPDSSKTLGIPQLAQSGDSLSYSTVTAIWTEAQKADTYRIKYWYTGEGSYETATIAETINASELSLDASDNFKFTFKLFAGDVDVSKAGKEITIAVDALNEGLQKEIGGGEIVTTSAENVTTRLVGPALLGLSASKAASASEITVSWNRISGADGYYVFRRQFNMDNAAEEGTEAIVYYVPASQSSSITITGKELALSAGTKVDATVVKAGIILENGKYTLHDTNMTDSEYNGTYIHHTPAYRDQQNNLAWGYPYRYYVVPVVNNEPIVEFEYNKDGSNKNTGIKSYTIQENGVGIKYSGAFPEQEGFAIGFGQNVVATKGTYASSGNVNDGIRITWESPPRLSTVAGFNPRYTLYRRAPGGVWTTATSVSERTYTDTTLDRGLAYEYVIGITNGGSGSASQPQDSRRFIDMCYTLRDVKNRPNMLGFMLGMVRMDSVSRNEIKIGDDFAEEVRWHNAGITNSANSNDLNWGIDGYTVFVMNRNIDANWHEIADMSDIPNQTNQGVYVTNNGNLLKVMRDYKHFFKVRSYVVKDGEKIYCPDPDWTYTYRFGTNQAAHIAASDQMQNDYVKWGARQITRDEFIQISLLYVARGLQRTNGNSWTSAYDGFPWYGDHTDKASTSYGGSGEIYTKSNAGVTSWDFDFRNYKDDLQDRTGQWKTFITVNGKLWAGTGAANQYPQRYGAGNPRWIDIIGPWDTPNLYTGRISIGGDGDDMYWNDANGRIYVIYPSANMTVRFKNQANEPLCEKVPWRGINTPLPYTGQGDERYQQDAWR